MHRGTGREIYPETYPKLASVYISLPYKNIRWSSHHKCSVTPKMHPILLDLVLSSINFCTFVTFGKHNIGPFKPVGYISYSCAGKRSRHFWFSTPSILQIGTSTRHTDRQTDGRTDERARRVMRPIRQLHKKGVDWK